MVVHLEADRELMCNYNIHMVELAMERLFNPFAYYSAARTEARKHAEFGMLMKALAPLCALR